MYDGDGAVVGGLWEGGMGALWEWDSQKRRCATMPIVFADTLPPSWDLVADIQILLHYHFMQNAYLAGTLVAITAGVMGYFMVLRSQSFAGHSLANVGFAGATGAVLFSIPSVVGLFIAGLCAAAGGQALNLAAPPNHQSGGAGGGVVTVSLALCVP